MDVTQYRGRLTPAQVADGINAANANARRLAGDAQALFDRASFATAASLAILAIEENGKAGILRRVLTAATDEELRECWKHYRRHSEKNHFLLIWDALKSGAAKLADFGHIFTDDTEDARRSFDLVKQFGFYTDCCGDAHWAVPAEVVDREFAGLMIRLADVITKDRHTVTARKMELWAEHMRNGATGENLLAWCWAAQAEQLHPEGYAEEMERMITVGFPLKPKAH
jgi:AbiV family abortive infection protein